jgi:hypothetical protein
MRSAARASCPVRLAAAVLCLTALARPPLVRDSISHPYQGVTYIDRLVSAPRPIHLHVVQIDAGAPGIRFKLSPHAGPREVMRQTTAAFLAAEHAQVAINAHYFWPWPSAEPEAIVIGIGASEGDVYSSFEIPEQSYALLPDAPGINIDAANQATIVHRDSTQPDGKHTREAVALWTTLAGSAQIVTDGIVTIPKYADSEHPDRSLTPGGPGNYSNDHSWYEALNARTAIGLSRDGRTITLFTVDVRGGSTGLSVREAAQALVKDYGVWNALNLDGGGSTSLAMEDPITHTATLMNTSSDSPGGRSVGSSLAVFAKSNQIQPSRLCFNFPDDDNR